VVSHKIKVAKIRSGSSLYIFIGDKFFLYLTALDGELLVLQIDQNLQKIIENLKSFKP
jgi:hypothetical protein